MELKNIIIIGATSAIAQHCARLWLTEPCRLLLVGRSEKRLARVADDLRVRSPQSDISCASVEFFDTAAIEALLSDATASDPLDLALIAHGDLPDQKQLQQNLAGCQDALALNAVSPALFAEALAAQMERAGRGQLALIGSVAGDRGRKSNYVYGSAKALLDRYAQGLQHRFAGTAISVSLIKPGPTSTPMTAHLIGSGTGLAPVEAVAKCIVEGIGKAKPVIYAPGKWALIMMVIRHLPRFIFNKLDI
jgi:decaprenylphospho-beta-D-erythro-pentofuranosid-2-ulose 2-reductase